MVMVDRGDDGEVGDYGEEMIKLRLRSQSDKQKFPQTQRVKKFRGFL
jgi:hypothetical protein